MAFEFGLFLAALTSAPMLRGAAVTLLLAVAVMATSVGFALPLAAGLRSPRAWLRWLLKGYVWLFRGAPMLLVLLFVWNALPQVWEVFRAPWFTPFLAAYVAMTLVTTAYVAEIMRAAYGGVGPGQREAAMALGLKRLPVFGLVVLPQALRVAMPPLVNEFISLLKTTSLAYTISLRELMTVTSLSISASFRFTEWYAAALVYYLVMVSALMILQGVVERRLERAYVRRDSHNRRAGSIPRRDGSQRPAQAPGLNR